MALDTLTDVIAPPLDPAAVVDSPAERLVRDGDMAALAQLYDEHHAAVRALARRLIGEAGAEDLVHDTFITLPKALRRWHGRGALRTFILGVAINHARHRVRASARQSLALARFAQEPPCAAPSQEDASEQRRLAEQLLRALDTLSFDHRTAFVLCDVEERSSPEVAAILGIPEATVRTRLHHARQKLRAALGGDR